MQQKFCSQRRGPGLRPCSVPFLDRPALSKQSLVQVRAVDLAGVAEVLSLGLQSSYKDFHEILSLFFPNVATFRARRTAAWCCV